MLAQKIKVAARFLVSALHGTDEASPVPKVDNFLCMLTLVIYIDNPFQQ